MFRWCSYCQHFMGEAEPLGRYFVTHGVCPACKDLVQKGRYRRTPTGLTAQRIFHALFSAEPHKGFSLPERLIQEALDAHINPSELVIGILQPALYRIGLMWEKGLITPAEERDFSVWCESVLNRFPRKCLEEDHARIVLTTAQGNVHNLGIRFFATYLDDHGMACRLIVPGLSEDALLADCLSRQPAYCGISVALPEGIAPARALAEKIRAETNGRTSPFLGGFAFRYICEVDPSIPVFHTLEDVREFVSNPAESA